MQQNNSICTNIYADINKSRIIITLCSLAALFLAVIADLAVGSANISAQAILTALWAGPNAQTVNTVVLWGIRLPMTLTCIFVGGSLGVAGLQVQTITNNPLASPYTLGISAAASFGAAISITVGFAVAGYLWLGTSLLAFLLAMLVSMLIFFMGKLKGMSTTTLILTGIIMNFFFSALQQFLQYRASAEIAQVISSWTFGNLARSTWTSVAVNSVILVSGSLLLLGLSWKLTALSAGEERAYSLGINVEKLRFGVFVISAFLISEAVAFIGTVGFVGLVAPHCARLLLGEDQRYLLPLSACFGGLLMLLSSVVSKMMSVGSMLPVGIVTSIVGVPFLFVLLLRHKG
ncbi:MAG: iron ABC transporter permease [Syntrophomonas sp.]